MTHALSRRAMLLAGLALSLPALLPRQARAQPASGRPVVVSSKLDTESALLGQMIALVLEAQGFGMGQRSQRYSMLVKDGVVDQLNIEQGGEFKVSSAEHLLAQL